MRVLDERRRRGGWQLLVRYASSEERWTARAAFRSAWPTLAAAWDRAEAEAESEDSAADAVDPPQGGEEESDDAGAWEAAAQPAGPGRAADGPAGAQASALTAAPAGQLADVLLRMQLAQERQEALLAAALSHPVPVAGRPGGEPRRLPASTNLREFDGAADALDAWLRQWELCKDAFELGDRDAWRFAASRLTGAASVWYLAKARMEREALAAPGALAKALRAEFQPEPPRREARKQLHALRQGSRHVTRYVADFRRLLALIRAGPGEDEAMMDAFEAGLRADLAKDVRQARCTTLQAAIELVVVSESYATGGGAIGAQAPNQQRTGATGAAGLHHINAAGEEGATGAAGPDLHEVIRKQGEAIMGLQHSLNAVSLAGGAPYSAQRGGGWRGGSSGRGAGGRGGGGRGRGSSGGDRRRWLPDIPGVPTELVRTRMNSDLCAVCGATGHRMSACPQRSN